MFPMVQTTNRVGNQTSSYKLQENITMQDTSMIMSVWFSGFNFSSFAQILDLSTALQVSKYQKQIFLKLHCPKSKQKFDKFLPWNLKSGQINKIKANSYNTIVYK